MCRGPLAYGHATAVRTWVLMSAKASLEPMPATRLLALGVRLPPRTRLSD
jgi:hypothetical protein